LTANNKYSIENNQSINPCSKKKRPNSAPIGCKSVRARDVLHGFSYIMQLRWKVTDLKKEFL